MGWKWGAKLDSAGEPGPQAGVDAPAVRRGGEFEPACLNVGQVHLTDAHITPGFPRSRCRNLVSSLLSRTRVLI